MNDQISSLNSQKEATFEEEQYVEEEDEDFNPDDENPQMSSDEGEDGDEDDGKAPKREQRKRVKNDVDYSQIESESGGLIKTRRGRLLQQELDRKRKYETMEKTEISDTIKGVWEDLQSMSDKRLGMQGSVGSILADDDSTARTNSASNAEEETILIKRDYIFAGERIHEEKLVPKSSAEAQEYLNSTKFDAKEEAGGKGSKTESNVGQEDDHVSETKSSKFHVSKENLARLRRPLKRPPILEQIIAGSLKPKLTTLEKSSLDWATYVDKENINDELTLHNKDGYLARQDFLNKVEHFKDNQYKELRQKQLALQAQQNQ